MRNLTVNSKLWRSAAGAVAGQTAVTGAGLDMRGFEAATFVALIGAVAPTGTVTLAIQASDDDGVADAYGALEGATASLGADDDDGLLVVEVTKPRKRYLRAVLTRGTANSVVDGILAIQTGPKEAPVMQSLDVVGISLVHAPPES